MTAPEPTDSCGWTEARRRAHALATARLPSSVALEKAIGNALACAVTAMRNIPHYSSSAMDGWAVCGGGPWYVIAAGRELKPGQASVIATGGAVPQGAVSVLRRESGTLARNRKGQLTLSLKQNAKLAEVLPGRHIRPEGEEAQAGDVLIPAGTLLSPAHVALAAAAGWDELSVYPKPQVAVVCTGSEIVASGQPAAGQVRDVFGPQLATVVSQLGGAVISLIRIGDSDEDWLRTFSCTSEGLKPDVVITIGGTGKSSSDHLRSAIDFLGGRVILDGIPMRPGHPAALAELRDGRMVIGLPGNPLAAMMALMTIGEPLFSGFAGLPLNVPQQAISGADVEAEQNRTRLLPSVCRGDSVSPVSYISAGMLRGLAVADSVMVVPPGGVRTGEPVRVLPLPWATVRTLPWSPTLRVSQD